MVLTVSPVGVISFLLSDFFLGLPEKVRVKTRVSSFDCHKEISDVIQMSPPGEGSKEGVLGMVHC